MEENNRNGVGLLGEERSKMKIDILNLGCELGKAVGTSLARFPIRFSSARFMQIDLRGHTSQIGLAICPECRSTTLS